MPTTRKTSAAKKPAAKTRKTKAKATQRKAPAARAKPAKKAARVTSPAKEVVIKDEPASTGRPTIYTEEIANTICERLIEGQTIREIAEDDAMPSKRTITRWATEPKHPFWPLYVRAREAQCIGMAEEILEISDDGSNDWMERTGKDGESLGWQLNGEHVQRSKLRVDTRKWVLSKVLPRVYGDKITAEHTGKDGGPIEVENVGEMEMARRVAFALGRALTKKQESQQIEDAQVIDET